MAERSFKSEVAKLRLGAGEEFRGEGILAVTKALLQSGVSYVSGYRGAPISHLVMKLSQRWIAICHDHIWRRTNQFFCKCLFAVGIAGGPTIIDLNVTALDPA